MGDGVSSSFSLKSVFETVRLADAARQLSTKESPWIVPMGFTSHLSNTSGPCGHASAQQDPLAIVRCAITVTNCVGECSTLRGSRDGTSLALVCCLETAPGSP